jgi:hypothetical protein
MTSFPERRTAERDTEGRGGFVVVVTGGGVVVVVVGVVPPDPPEPPEPPVGELMVMLEGEPAVRA